MLRKYEILKDGVFVNSVVANESFLKGNYPASEGYTFVSLYTPEEIAQTEAREWRDQQLKETDWIVSITDYPNHASVLTYRQQLRDWPADADFPSGESRPVSPLQ